MSNVIRAWRSIPALYRQWASRVGEGMTLEILADDGELLVATIVADDDDVQWLELYPGDQTVRVRLSDLLQAVEVAKEGVHGERFYDDPGRESREDT